MVNGCKLGHCASHRPLCTGCYADRSEHSATTTYTRHSSSSPYSHSGTSSGRIQGGRSRYNVRIFLRLWSCHEIEQYLRLSITTWMTRPNGCPSRNSSTTSKRRAQLGGLPSSSTRDVKSTLAPHHPITPSTERVELYEEFALRMQKVREETESALRGVADDMKRFHDRKHHFVEFAQDEKVYLNDDHTVAEEVTRFYLEDLTNGLQITNCQKVGVCTAYSTFQVSPSVAMSLSSRGIPI